MQPAFLCFSGLICHMYFNIKNLYLISGSRFQMFCLVDLAHTLSLGIQGESPSKTVCNNDAVETDAYML